MVEGMQRALDVSFLESLLIPIGGQEFRLAPQSAPQLERILNAMHPVTEIKPEDTLEETPEEKKLPWGTVLVGNFTESIPIIAMMFSFDPASHEGKEAIAHLHEFLVPKLAARIYEEWRRINDIDDFFVRGGRPLLDPELITLLKKAKMADLEETVEEAVAAVGMTAEVIPEIAPEIVRIGV